MEHTHNGPVPYTASDALTDALVDAGVTHVFLNSGTDYPPIIESWAKYEAMGQKKPEIISAPHSTPRSAARASQLPAGAGPCSSTSTSDENLARAPQRSRCRVPSIFSPACALHARGSAGAT
jgi:hypothetical protein